MVTDLTDFIKIGDLIVEGDYYSVSRLSSLINDVSMRKISVDITSGNHKATDVFSPLSVVRVDSGTYLNKIKGTSKELSNALYLVESENLNAYGKRAINVALPVEQTDAASKQYVDQVLETYETRTSRFYGSRGVSNRSGILSSEIIFDKMLKNLTEEEFKIKYFSIRTSDTTTVASLSNVQLEISDADEHILATSEPLGKSPTFDEELIFEFNSDYLFNKTTRYLMRFKNGSNYVQYQIRVAAYDTSYPPVYTASGTASYYGMIIPYIVVATEYDARTGMIMSDKLDPTKRYLIQLYDGEIQVVPIG